jgi:acyl-CoA thioester hydrolase
VVIDKMPGIRIHFSYELYNEAEELINLGETTLVFVDMEKNKPCLPPEEFLNKMAAYFN